MFPENTQGSEASGSAAITNDTNDNDKDKTNDASPEIDFDYDPFPDWIDNGNRQVSPISTETQATLSCVMQRRRKDPVSNGDYGME